MHSHRAANRAVLPGAPVVELVDALNSKSSFFGSARSSRARGTTLSQIVVSDENHGADLVLCGVGARV